MSGDEGEEEKNNAEVAGEEAAAKEEESTATFEPVVKLEEVDVTSGEEDENVLYNQRCKLFLFGETMLDAGTGTKSWKERGIGQLRILQHKEHSRCRILMRQEKTMKLLINHMLIPGLKLVAHDTSDRAYVWRAEDFADGVVKETDFCVRFADSDLAQAFHQAFVKYQQEMEDLLAGKDKPGNDADEVAEALEGLTTKAEKTAAEKE